MDTKINLDEIEAEFQRIRDEKDTVALLKTPVMWPMAILPLTRPDAAMDAVCALPPNDDGRVMVCKIDLLAILSAMSEGVGVMSVEGRVYDSAEAVVADGWEPEEVD